MTRVFAAGFLSLYLCVVAACGEQTSGAPRSRPAEIEATFPNPGDLILSQGEVGADIPQAWDLTLTIDATPIPRDQIQVVEALGVWKFLPRPGRVIERLPPGERTARVTIRSPDGARSVDYEWSFRVGA